MATSTIKYAPFCKKQKLYVKSAMQCLMSVAEGSIRSGKTILHCIIASAYLETCPDKIHLASGSSLANAKLNIGACNGFGLENLFRGRCRWGKYKSNDCLYIQTQTGEKIVIFAGGGLANSYKKILGNSYGLWIATEINEHYDSDDSRESFIKVAFGRQTASIRPLILWDLNPCSPYHKIYSEYIDKYLTGFKGGYNYGHFTLDDNLSITAKRREEIASQYTEGSIWYRRDILGERCSPDGLCFQEIADDLNSYLLDEAPKDIVQIRLGVDFGGNKSQHSFTATALTRNLRKVVALASRIVKAKDLTPTQLASRFCDFALMIYQEYNKGMVCYCDSAEQTLINGIRAEVIRRQLPVDIRNAKKTPIIDRIRLINTLSSQRRVFFIRNTTRSLQDALCGAIWDKKQAECGVDVRLDDGTTDIDSCDSFEYTIETERENLINCGRNL